MDAARIMSLNQASSPLVGKERKDAALEAACVDFEALVVSQMFATMRSTVSNDGLLPRSQAEQIFQQMLDSEYAEQMAQTKTTGLAAGIYQQMSQQPSLVSR